VIDPVWEREGGGRGGGWKRMVGREGNHVVDWEKGRRSPWAASS